MRLLREHPLQQIRLTKRTLPTVVTDVFILGISRCSTRFPDGLDHSSRTLDTDCFVLFTMKSPNGNIDELWRQLFIASTTNGNRCGKHLRMLRDYSPGS